VVISKRISIGALLYVGLLSGAHAVYVGGNPISYVDPKGLDAVVVTGGYRGGANFFGHTGMGVTGNGMYSYGNDTPLGSSVADYLRSQSQYRDQIITFIPTTPAQDAAAARFFASKPGKNSVGYFDNCAVRTNQGLEAAGLPTNGIPLPGGVSRDAANFPGATTYFIPQGGPIPPEVTRRLPAFNGGTP
jgi:hypothetical protein